MKLTDYLHTSFTYKANKLQIPPVEMPFAAMEEFNEIYQYVKTHFMKVEPTKSKSIPCGSPWNMYSRYMIVEGRNKIELTIVCHEGCYRFLIGNKRNEDKNPVSGKEAVRAIYKAAKEIGIDLSKYKVDKNTGLKLKNEIHAPHIKMYGVAGLAYTNVHHLDLNSSYASRIIEKEPDFKTLYEYMYIRRHDYDEYYKHVLTNHIGCWQSQYCPDYNDPGKIAPYQFAGLSKIAVNETYNMIEYYVDKLTKAGRKVLLTNTDGIWYQGDLFHDENEGDKLGQWKNDHKNCKLLMKSKGAYQYVEGGKCHSVVRGLTLLDREKDRDDWEFGEILNQVNVEYYVFNEEVGVEKYVKEL